MTKIAAIAKTVKIVKVRVTEPCLLKPCSQQTLIMMCWPGLLEAWLALTSVTYTLERYRIWGIS